MQWQGEYAMVSSKLPSLAIGCQNDEMVDVDDKSVAKMSGGDVGVEPSLSSRNMLGNGNRDSNSQSKRVKIVGYQDDHNG